MSDQTKTYQSTDQRLNYVPKMPSEYRMLKYAWPTGYDQLTEEAKFREKASQNRWPIGQLAEEFDQHFRTVSEASDRARQAAEKSQMASIAQSLDEASGMVLTLEEHIALRDKYVNDPKSDYWDDRKPAAQEKRIEMVNVLNENINQMKASGNPRASIERWYLNAHSKKEEVLKQIYGSVSGDVHSNGKSSGNGRPGSEGEAAAPNNSGEGRSSGYGGLMTDAA